jgi:hypothetical protein
MLDPTQFKHFCFKPPKGGKHNFFVEQCTMLGFVTLAFVAWKSLWVGGWTPYYGHHNDFRKRHLEHKLFLGPGAPWGPSETWA